MFALVIKRRHMETKNHYTDIPTEADRLNIAQRTLWRWIKARRVPSYKVGRRILLRPDEVDIALGRFRSAAIGEGK
jgi:excisionase family DNA binding protein